MGQSLMRPMAPMIALQATLQSKVCPATWLPGVRNFHSEEAEWTFESSTTPDDAMDSVWAAAEALPDFVGRSMDKNLRTIVVDTLTKKKWMDQIRIKVSPPGEDGTFCKARVVTSSTGFLPLIVPAAPFLNMVLFFVPFGDGGKCAQEMGVLRKKAGEILGAAIGSETIRYSITNPQRFKNKSS